MWRMIIGAVALTWALGSGARRASAAPSSGAWAAEEGEGWAEVAAWADHYGPQVGIDPVVLVAIMRLETGRRPPFPMRYSITGIKGDYGPILSAKAAELFGEPDLKVFRDYSITSATTEEDATGAKVPTTAKFRAYPDTDGVSGVRRAVADLARMLSQGSAYRSAGVTDTTDPYEQIRRIGSKYATASDWSATVADIYQRLVRRRNKV